MKNINSLSLVAILLPCVALAADSAPSASKKPSEVLSKLHMANQSEIEMGQLAQKKGHSDEVKRYGERLVRDHRDADHKVTKLAQDQKIELTKIEPTDEQKQVKEKLQKLSGPSFDREFADAMEKDHEKDISELKSAQSELGSKSPVSKLIAELLPKLQKHEHIAESIERQAGGEAAEHEEHGEQ